MEKPDSDMFDPKNFLAKVGAGKQVLEFHKNQHVFEQGDVADTVFYIQKGKVCIALNQLAKPSCVAARSHGVNLGHAYNIRFCSQHWPITFGAQYGS